MRRRSRRLCPVPRSPRCCRNAAARPWRFWRPAGRRSPALLRRSDAPPFGSGVQRLFSRRFAAREAFGMEPPMQPISVVFALAACLLATGALAQQYKLGSLEIDHPWSRATPKGAKTGGGYVCIKNTGSAPDRLVGGSFADARKVELHHMTMDQGVMKMRPVAGGLEIKPGETVELKPEGYHLMFVGLKQALKKGDQVDGA